METFDYAEFHTMAKELMDYFCPEENSTWTRIVKTFVDPTKPFKGETKMPQDNSCKIIYLETRDRVEEFNLTQFIPESELASDATFGFMHPQGFEPEPGDTVKNLRGQHFTAKKVRAIAPVNEPIFYILTLT